jgi:hypothetical protein
MQIGSQPFLNLADNPRGVGCGTGSNFGRMSRRQQSKWILNFTGKQKDRIYRSEPIPVNPVFLLIL